MPQLQTNLFTSWDFSEAEALQAQALPPLTVCMIQNRISMIATDKLNLTFDPANPHFFLQREAELQGQLGILRILLSQSENAIAALNHQ